MSLKHIGNLDDLDVSESLVTFVRNVTGEEVTVDFASGAATLSGRVRSAAARRAIEDLVASHDGVTSVANNIIIATPAHAPPQESSRPA